MLRNTVRVLRRGDLATMVNVESGGSTWQSAVVYKSRRRQVAATGVATAGSPSGSGILLQSEALQKQCCLVREALG